MAEKEEKLTIPHVQASNYRVAVADGATISVLTDALGTTFNIIFTRLEAPPISEIVTVVKQDGGIRQLGSGEINQPMRKVQEVGVLLRPDHAFQIAQKLLDLLSQLVPAQRQRYGIPEIAPKVTNESEKGQSE